MTNYTATAFTASNESSRFWGFFFILVAPAVQGCVGCCCKAKPDIQGRGCKSAAFLLPRIHAAASLCKHTKDGIP